MSAARRRVREDARTLTVLVDGALVTMPYRQAVGLLSLGRAVNPPTKPARKKKVSLSTPDTTGVQEGEETEKKPSPAAVAAPGDANGRA